MRPMRHWKRIKAKYAGAVCWRCQRTIQAGDEIYWKRGATPSHVDCETSRLKNTGCTACGGTGLLYGNHSRYCRPCPACDGTGSRDVQEFARKGGHPRKDEPISQYVKPGTGLRGISHAV